jgi:coenzyme F420-0:L-glutamate ligase/coenzyme F420-1:gamma-L-glutamate ligase
MNADCAISLEALTGIGDVVPGDDLPALIGAALPRNLRRQDVIVVAQKIVSKAEGRLVRLAEVTPSPRALDLAAVTHKDARIVELILAESTDVLRAAPGVLVVRHRLGLVMANAGIDRSNVNAEDSALLLPLAPDASAARLRDGLGGRFGAAPGIIISDSFGRAWRMGTVNIAIGAAGLPTLIDWRGRPDRYGRKLEATMVAFADAVAAAAGLVMGEAAEGCPAVLVGGLRWDGPDDGAAALIRPRAEDLFL